MFKRKGNLKTITMHFSSGRIITVVCADWNLKWDNFGVPTDFQASGIKGAIPKYVKLSELIAVVEDA